MSHEWYYATIPKIISIERFPSNKRNVNLNIFFSIFCHHSHIAYYKEAYCN